MDLTSSMNKNVTSIQPEGISTFNTQIANIAGVIKLTVGEPDFNTPEHVKKAGIKAIENNMTHYTIPSGAIAVRKAAASFVEQKYGLKFDPATEVVTTVGVSEAILDVYLALLNPGDEVLLPTPAFPVYAGAIKIAGGKVVPIDVSADHFKLTPARLTECLATHPNAKALLLNTPNNPTGQSYTEDELKALAMVVKNNALFVISDEIYSEITYSGSHHSISQFARSQTIVFNGLSKSHAMTGWRFGVIFAPQPIMDAIAKVHLFNTYNVSSIVQAAAVEAFTNGIDDAAPMVKIYRQRRDLVVEGLAKAGIKSVPPTSAFYIFARIPDSYGQDDRRFCLDLARDARVGVVPGSAFGPGGEGYFRISYAASTAELTESVNRIQKFVAATAPAS